MIQFVLIMDNRCCSICSLGSAPVTLSTILPSLKKSMVGILRIPYCEAVSGFSSTLSLTTFTAIGVIGGQLVNDG